MASAGEALARVQMPGMREPTNCGSSGKLIGAPGNPTRGRGRPRGSPNKMGHDLMTLVMQAAENVGFVEKNEKGEWVATGKGGVLKYLEWAAVHKSERFMALMGRIAPKHVFADATHHDDSMTEAEIEAELIERGLPVDLLPLLLNPEDEVLDPGEDPDPYGLMKNVTPEKAPDDTAK
jgi:hypothetical protein